MRYDFYSPWPVVCGLQMHGVCEFYYSEAAYYERLLFHMGLCGVVYHVNADAQARTSGATMISIQHAIQPALSG